MRKIEEEFILGIAEFVRSKREELNISQRELSRKAHLANNIIQRIEAPKKGGKYSYNPKILTLFRICDALDTDLKQLIKYIHSK